jgi:hypothetical protein
VKLRIYDLYQNLSANIDVGEYGTETTKILRED